MPTLAQLVGTSSDPTITQFTTSDPIVEPLDGPSNVDDVMDRFPEEVYQQGRDTHLYRFLTALGGDSGAGLLKAQAYVARLSSEAEFLVFQILDQLYVAQFQFNRLKQETYPNYNPTTDALTATEWDSILLADQQYRQRVLDFFTALRYGNAPKGLALMAQAGCGVECDLVENYKWIYDQMSDSPLGLEFIGTTSSTSEFIIVPRFINDEIESPLLEYQENVYHAYVGHAPVGTAGPTVTVSFDYDADGVSRMVPDVEHNVIDLLDRLRPVTTLASIIPDDIRFSAVDVNTPIHASSTRRQTSRLVTGQTGVPWPPLDPTQNYFIQANVENESGQFYGGARELPTVFLTVENVHAYTDAALADPLYGTNEFFDASSGISAYMHYESEQYGAYTPTMVAIYPFLANVSADTVFVANSAIAINDTPLMVEGNPISD